MAIYRDTRVHQVVRCHISKVEGQIKRCQECLKSSVYSEQSKAGLRWLIMSHEKKLQGLQSLLLELEGRSCQRIDDDIL